MKYISEDNNFVQAKCEKCFTYLDISKNRCTKIESTFLLNLPYDCKCGAKADIILKEDISIEKYKDIKIKKQAKDNRSDKFAYSMVTLTILIFIICIGAVIKFFMSLPDSTEIENAKFYSQMHKPPWAWNKEERQRFNNFVNWQKEQFEEKWGK